MCCAVKTLVRGFTVLQKFWIQIEALITWHLARVFADVVDLSVFMQCKYKLF